MKKKQLTKAPYLLHGGDYNPDQWLDYPEILEQDIKLMEKANTNAFSIGMFSWASLEPAEGVYNFEWLDKVFERIHSIGGHILLATPSGARPAWMSQKYPEVLRTNAERQKLLHGGRHNHCFSSPVYRNKVKNINRKLAERYGDHPALIMWHVSNEYSGECHCELCQENFRNYLKEKYDDDLDKLNHAWWGPFWSHTITDWNQIESPSPIGENAVHGMNLDWQRYVTHQTIDFYKNEIKPLKKITPDIPLTTNFMADNPDLIPFQGLDYSEFAKEVDVISWDAYPAWHNDRESTADVAMKVAMVNDLYRSLKQQPFLLLESTPSAVNWIDYNKAKRPGMHYLSAMQMLAHGSDSNMYFQWRQSRGSSEKFHGAVVGHDMRTDNRVFEDVEEVGKVMNKMPFLAGSLRESDVAILYDWENNWAINDAQSFGENNRLYPQTVQEHYRTFWENDIPVDVITKEQDWDSYKLLIVPMLYMMSRETTERLQKYVKNGGSLVTTYLSGIVDENDLVHLGGWPKELRETFGIDVLENDTLYPSDRNKVTFEDKDFEMKHYASIIEKNEAESLGLYKEDFYKETPAITVNSYGSGNAYYIGARFEKDFHTDFYSQIIEELNLQSILSADSPGSVSIQGRKIDDETNLVFIMNFNEAPQAVYLEEEVVDIEGDNIVTGQLKLDPYEVKIVKNHVI